MKDLLRTADLSRADLELLIELAGRFKRHPYQHRSELRNETVVLHFAEPSTRTRLSLATAVARLGGVPVVVRPDELQLDRGETLEDTALSMSRLTRIVFARLKRHADLERFARAATIPVVNALTEAHHPLQSLADVLTLIERFGDISKIEISWVGDGTNVCHSLIEAIACLGGTIRIATPAGHEPDGQVLVAAKALGGHVDLMRDPREATRGAHVVYTDTWLSLAHDPSERDARIAALTPYRVDAALMACARPDAIFLHCLPDHRGEEVTAEVVDGPQSRVFDQAENRLHTAVALLHALVEGRLTGRHPVPSRRLWPTWRTLA
jgi:ornithine carbamoyltransferase